MNKLWEVFAFYVGVFVYAVVWLFLFKYLGTSLKFQEWVYFAMIVIAGGACGRIFESGFKLYRLVLAKKNGDQ